MKFTNLVLLIALAIFVSGCEMLAGKKDEETLPEEEQIEAHLTEEGTEAPLEGVEPVFVPIPNPNDSVTRPPVNKEADVEFAKAQALMEARKWQDAEGVLVLLTETYPAFAGPFVNLGIAQSKQDKTEAAESSFLKAIEVNALNFDAYLSLGLFYRENGRFADAEATYLKALAVWPHHQASVKNLGILYDLYMGRFDEALAQYELYQQLIGEEDRRVKGWIIDLGRRIEASKREAE